MPDASALEQAFATSTRDAPLGAVVTDRSGRFLVANDAAGALVGRTRAELLDGLTLYDLIVPEQHDGVRAALDPSHPIEQGAVERTMTRPDGTLVPVLVHRWTARPEADLVLALLVDLSDRARAEEEQRRLDVRLQQAQRLESLGVLAGGIAHEFNNLLVAILGNAELAMSELPPESPARATVADIETAAQRAAELTRQMLAFSGRGRFVIERIDLSRLVEEMRHLLEVSVTGRALLRYNLAEGLPRVEADAAQIRQVVMNLVTNASDAIGERSGVIAVRTGLVGAVTDTPSTVYPEQEATPGPFAFVEVSDTGVGMDPETRARIFDPFFSTKFTGRGLGLPAVLGIVRGHGGAVKVYTEPQRGSVFRVLLPCAPETGPVPAAAAEATTRTGTVLVVDDEETVRAVARRILEGMGLQVIAAADGVEALEQYRAHRDAIAVVLLDATMPRMDGEHTWAELRAIDPAVRVVLSSGYSEQEAMLQFAGQRLAGFLQKPYRRTDVVELFSRVLES